MITGHECVTFHAQLALAVPYILLKKKIHLYRTSMCVVLWCPITGPVCVVLWCPIQDQYVCGTVVPHTGPICVHP